MAGGSKHPGRSVISKISAIVVAVSEGGGRTLTEISTRSDLPLSTVHRLVTELAAWRVLERDGDGRYRAGASLRTIDSGCACPPPVPPVGTTRTGGFLRERAVPVMEDLFRATGAPVRVGFLDGTAVGYVEKVAAHRPVSWLSAAARLPAHATALGKVLLAFAHPNTIDVVIGRGLTRYTPATVTRPDRLLCSLKTVRATRIAVSCRELDHGASAVAVPAFGPGDVVAGIELGVRDVAQELPLVRAPLALAAGWLSRELTQLSPPTTSLAAPPQRGSA